MQILNRLDMELYLYDPGPVRVCFRNLESVHLRSEGAQLLSAVLSGVICLTNVSHEPPHFMKQFCYFLLNELTRFNIYSTTQHTIGALSL